MRQDVGADGDVQRIPLVHFASSTDGIASPFKAIQHTVRYTELSPDRFKDFWR